LSMAERYYPDAIVFAYIPHDLLRPASDFNFGLSKPKFRFDGPHSVLHLAEGMEEFPADYEAARSGFHLSWWFARRYWENREYHLPGLTKAYFDQLYRHIGKSLARLSHEQGIPVVVVKLTNFRHFSGFDQLVGLAKTGLAQQGDWAKADLRYLDTDACVTEKANAIGLDIAQTFAHHPTAQGHRLLADCIGGFIEPIVLRVGQGSAVDNRR
ncbi:MAG: hypothetical protein ACOYMG_24615, partial [Candidatus Methylumidiphilus sp.]